MRINSHFDTFTTVKQRAPNSAKFEAQKNGSLLLGNKLKRSAFKRSR